MSSSTTTTANATANTNSSTTTTTKRLDGPKPVDVSPPPVQKLTYAHRAGARPSPPPSASATPASVATTTAKPPAVATATTDVSKSSAPVKTDGLPSTPSVTKAQQSQQQHSPSANNNNSNESNSNKSPKPRASPTHSDTGSSGSGSGSGYNNGQQQQQQRRPYRGGRGGGYRRRGGYRGGHHNSNNVSDSPNHRQHNNNNNNNNNNNPYQQQQQQPAQHQQPQRSPPRSQMPQRDTSLRQTDTQTLQYYDQVAYARYQQQSMQAFQMQMVMPTNYVPVFCCDVECVASGPRHDQRIPAQLSVVDQWERVVLNVYIKPEVPVFSYLPQLTGLSEEILNKGVSMVQAQQMLKQVIPPNAVFVGQNILQDMRWLNFVEGRDYAGLLDLAGLWRAKSQKFKGYTYFSLHHEAKALLGILQETPHNAATDAIVSMRLYNLHQQIKDNPQELEKAHHALLTTSLDASFAKSNPVYDGVCMGQKKQCNCGAPFFY